jgi:SAM-dependent methyltransferase
VINVIKRKVRRYLHSLGLKDDWEQKGSNAFTYGVQQGPEYYNRAFNGSADFSAPYYRSSYYSTWTIVADRIKRYGLSKVLDIGCGPGQFAEMLDAWEVTSYVGIDFSDFALSQANARVKNPNFTFLNEDITRRDSTREFDFDCVVCMEVLEHIDDDLNLLSALPRGVRCLCTVPNFPHTSHVRHFVDEDAVTERYRGCFASLSVTAIKGTRNADEWFYLLDGVR